MSTYADPAAPTGVDLKALNGALLLIEVKGQEIGKITQFGPADPIEADIAILDGDSKGDTLANALIFPRVLISQLKPYIGSGSKVLGRLGQGTAKPGQSAPWTLHPATDADRETAAKYEAYAATKAAAVEEAF